MSEQQTIINNRSMLPVGTLLQGRKYRIDRYLSSGGFGNTYVATNLLFEEVVALKEFYIRGVTERNGDSVSISVSNEENVLQFAEQKAKFIKEARRLRKLKDNHIVTVHDLFEENGTAYYAMDYIEGESISERLKRTGQPIEEKEAVDILNQILDALEVVHRHGIFHLDIKPANIMIDKQGCALLIDFGASKQTKQEGGATTSTGLSYTPGYAPIEQMAQNLNQFGPWTDIYSLGATLYHMLTLHQLPSPADLLENEELLQMPQNISSHTQQLVRQMMTPVRIKRPQSITEVRHILNKQNVDEATIVISSSAYKTKETPQIKPPVMEEALSPNIQVLTDTTPDSVSYIEENDDSFFHSKYLKLIAIFVLALLFFWLIYGYNSNPNRSFDDNNHPTNNTNALPEFDANKDRFLPGLEENQHNNTQTTSPSSSNDKEHIIKRKTETKPATNNNRTKPVNNHSKQNGSSQRSPMDNISF